MIVFQEDMMRNAISVFGLSLLIGCSTSKNIYEFSATTIDGEEKSLSDYKGQVLLVVNLASECGLTPQYAELQKLHESFSSEGFAVVGFPCNQFGGQEPGSDEDIKSFCSVNYGVTFPLFSKIEVNGDSRHDLYDYLAGSGAAFPGDISWNFEKFLISSSGEVLNRFEPGTEPDQQEVVSAIETALSEK